MPNSFHVPAKSAAYLDIWARMNDYRTPRDSRVSKEELLTIESEILLLHPNCHGHPSNFLHNAAQFGQFPYLPQHWLTKENLLSHGQPAELNAAPAHACANSYFSTLPVELLTDFDFLHNHEDKQFRMSVFARACGNPWEGYGKAWEPSPDYPMNQPIEEGCNLPDCTITWENLRMPNRQYRITCFEEIYLRGETARLPLTPSLVANYQEIRTALKEMYTKKYDAGQGTRHETANDMAQIFMTRLSQAHLKQHAQKAR